MNILTINTISLQMNMNRVGIVHLYHSQLLRLLKKTKHNKKQQKPNQFMTLSWSIRLLRLQFSRTGEKQC